jgi:hypothetical protein
VDEAEQDRIYALMREYNGLTTIWIGLNDDGHPKYYDKWANTNEAVTYTNWDYGEPNSVSSQRSCVRLYGPLNAISGHGKWDDDKCDR